jgi:predicted RNA-binding protein YlqC (UPF0109 family)
VKELLEFLVRSLVDAQEAVSVTETPGGAQPIFKIAVAQGEIGKIIGRQGRTVKAIRAVAAAMERKTGQRAVVEIAE